MRYFTIFQDKLHSVNIQDDQSWALSETVQKYYIVVLPTKPNRCLMKTMTIFLGLILNFVAKKQL